MPHQRTDASQNPYLVVFRDAHILGAECTYLWSAGQLVDAEGDEVEFQLQRLRHPGALEPSLGIGESRSMSLAIWYVFSGSVRKADARTKGTPKTASPTRFGA